MLLGRLGYQGLGYLAQSTWGSSNVPCIQQPSILMSETCWPRRAAVVAAPILKLCPANSLATSPAFVICQCCPDC